MYIFLLYIFQCCVFYTYRYEFRRMWPHTTVKLYTLYSNFRHSRAQTHSSFVHHTIPFTFYIHVSFLSDDGVVDGDKLSSALSTTKWFIVEPAAVVGPMLAPPLPLLPPPMAAAEPVEAVVDVVKHLGRPFTLFPITTTISDAGCSDECDSSCVCVCGFFILFMHLDGIESNKNIKKE